MRHILAIARTFFWPKNSFRYNFVQPPYSYSSTICYVLEVQIISHNATKCSCNTVCGLSPYVIVLLLKVRWCIAHRDFLDIFWQMVITDTCFLKLAVVSALIGWLLYFTWLLRDYLESQYKESFIFLTDGTRDREKT